MSSYFTNFCTVELFSDEDLTVWKKTRNSSKKTNGGKIETKGKFIFLVSSIFSF